MASVSIQIEGKSYDLDDFELGDLEWLEDHVGAPLSDDRVLTSMKALVGFVYLIKRQDDPSFTLDDARKIRLSVLQADDEEPEAEDKPAAKRRPTKAQAAS